jgi:uncharacterized protein (TIGR02588 family)
MTSKQNQQPTPFLERLLGGVGVVLLAACVAFLVYEGMNGDERPGSVSATVTDIAPAGDMYVVTFQLDNAGSQTLSNVSVTARLGDGNRDLETAQTTIDFLPGHSRQTGGFYFKNDPRKHELEIRPEGYQEP